MVAEESAEARTFEGRKSEHNSPRFSESLDARDSVVNKNVRFCAAADNIELPPSLGRAKAGVPVRWRPLHPRGIAKGAMPPRKTPRLAYCEYVIPDPKGSTAVWMARLDLMRTVQRVHPIMLGRLSSDVFPAYKALAETGFDIDAILWNDRRSPFTELGAVDPALIELKERIRAAEPSPAEANEKPISSDDQIRQAAEDGDSTFARLSNAKEAAAYRRRRQLAPKIEPKAVLRNCG